MDITHKFKAAVMAVKLQRKVGIEEDPKRIMPKPKLTKITTTRDEFHKQAKDVYNKIANLRQVLLENRSAYMRIGQHLKSAAQMSDEQRDLIDKESEKFVTYYTQYLAQMREDWKHAKRKPQQKQHMEAVLELLEHDLRNVEKIYTDQKKYRIQHELETYRLLKLAADRKKIPVRPVGERKVKRRENQKRRNSESSELSYTSSEDFHAIKQHEQIDSSSDTDLEDGWQNEAIKRGAKRTPSMTNSNTDLKTTTSKFAIDEELQKSQIVNEEEAKAAKDLSPEDMQMFEQENVQLYHELQGLSEEVEQIEKNVVDIAQLQDIFTEKVSLQQQNIERIANAVIGSTENVKDANEQIKQAIQRNAGLRVWSLFFLLVMSFTLLFLDWYYD